MTRAAGQETVEELLREGREALAASTADTSPREAFFLLGHVLGLDEPRLRARPERAVEAEDAEAYRALLARRAVGEPVAYLVGSREFYGRDFAVDARVLVPRPETEHLVETVLELAPDLPPSPTILDIGTGSGCIAVTLAAEMPAARVAATDVSPGALAVTTTNARRHRVVDRVHRVGCDVATAVDLGTVDLVVSNPPYIAHDAAPSLPIDVREHEPQEALFADDVGRAVIERIFESSKSLRPGVPVLLEIGHDQAPWIRETVARTPRLELDRFVRDYGGHERVAVLRRTEEAKR